MKILHVLNSNRFSGAENVVCQIIRMMKDDTDFDMVYCSRDGQIREALIERNIKFAPVNDLTMKELKRVINEQKPDIVHAHDMRASFVASLVCGPIELISHIHNNAFDSRNISLKSIAYYIAAKKAQHIFWVSQSAFEGYAFKNSFKQKSSVLSNIIDMEQLYNKMSFDQNSYDYDVVYLGRLTYPKNPQRLMKVCELLMKKKPDIKVAVIGTGEFEEEVKNLATAYKINGNVTFLGFQSNPLKILHDSKVMIMTSRWEGTPMCALEALSVGVPIVSTPVDGLKDLVINSETGYLCEYDEGLTDAIMKLIDNKEHRRQLSENALMKARIVNNKEQYKNQIIGLYKLLDKSDENYL